MFVIKILYSGKARTVESEKSELVVGRSTPAKEVDIDMTPDKMVSRKHLILKTEYNMANAKNEAWLHDQGSSLGTVVNGNTVVDPIKLEPDDKIEIGESTINVRLKIKQKPKKKVSFEEKVVVRNEPSQKDSILKSSSSKPGKQRTPPSSDKKIAPPLVEEVSPNISSHDEITLGVPSNVIQGGITQTECAGFVAYSVEDLATAVNRHARQNKMYAISSSIVQEGKGSSACFRAMVVFHVPDTN